MYWAKFEQFQVVERRKGAVYKTRRLGEKWFAQPDFPQTYIPDAEDKLWANTTETHFGSTPPQDHQ